MCFSEYVCLFLFVLFFLPRFSFSVLPSISGLFLIHSLIIIIIIMTMIMIMIIVMIIIIEEKVIFAVVKLLEQLQTKPRKKITGIN